MIVIDTHVLVWALDDDPRLGPQTLDLIVAAGRNQGVHVSAITPWEIAMLAHKGRLALGREIGAWMDAALAAPGIVLEPILPAIAIDAVRLPGQFHADPADRLIVATARHLGLPLVTADQAILIYGAGGHAQVLNAAR